MKKWIVTILVLLVNFYRVFAQCPMCRASAETSNYANGLNKGILYLLFIPFFLVLGVVVFWYFNRNKFKINS